MKKLPAWAILSLIAIVAGLLLSTTNGVTAPIIAASALADAQAVRAALLPAADSFRELPLTEEAPEGLSSCYEGLSGDSVAGHVATITVNGFGGPIEISVGLDQSNTITAVNVGGADFAETAGLGARTKEPAFTGQFAGLPAPVALGSGIDAVTGATISSTAVVNGVNAAVAYITGVDAQTGATAVSE